MAQQSARDALIDRLVAETGITRDEATELVDLIGPNWTSLIREAELLNKTRNSSPKP